MGEELRMIWVLAIGFSVACALGFFAQKLKLSPILGYLIAGYIIGPHSPGYIVDPHLSNQMANIGVTLLMFAVGLHLNWADLNAVKKIVVPGGLILSFLSILAGLFLTLCAKESLAAGLVIGIAVCVSSTVVMARVLSDQKLLRTSQGYIVMGWTIVEDLISVFGLVLLPSFVYLANHDAASSLYLTFSSMAMVMLKIAAFALLIYVLGEKVIVKILKVVARTQSHELFTLAILACVFLIAVGSSSLFGISLALGAFVAGKMIGDTDLNHHAAANALPMRDAFSVLFFISVGMLFDPAALGQNLFLFFGLLAILLILRPLFAFGILKMWKYPSFIGFTAAAAIAQIGEYSFILAQEGARLKILPDNSYDIIVACSFITIALNPLLFQFFHSYMNPKKQDKNSSVNLEVLKDIESANGQLRPKALVIGYGPVGRAVCKQVSSKNQVIVIDQNYEILAGKREKNIFRLFGDATKVEILEQAHVKEVEALYITIPDVNITESIIQLSLFLNKELKIYARVHFHSDVKKLKIFKIPVVCDEEMAAKQMQELAKEFK